MAYLRLVLADADLAALKSAALAERLSTSAWARNALVKHAQAASPLQTASEAPRLDRRTAAKYATLRANLAENGRTVEQWATDRARDRLATQADHDHTARMLEIWHAEQGERS